MTARFGTKRRTKGIVTNHGMPVRWSTAHYRFSRAPCTATLSVLRLLLARSSPFLSLFHHRPLFLPPMTFPSRSLSVAPSLSLFLSSTSHRSSSFSFPLSFPLFLRTATVSLARAHSSTVRCVSTCRRGTRAAFPPCLSCGVPLSEAITDFSRLLRRHSLPPPPHTTPPPCLPLTLSIRLAPPLDDASRLFSSLLYSLPPILFSLFCSLSLSLSFCRLNYIAPPVDRSSNSTMCREIKFVYSHFGLALLHRIQAATKLDKTADETGRS